ncbi:MAG: hypothetical protein AAGU11_15660 [Syntrophobacteraceae bacterium]
MQDDLVTALTRQVKEEVIENYLLERRLIELQQEHLAELALQARALAESTGTWLSRLANLMVGPEFTERLSEMLGLPVRDFWPGFLSVRHTRPGSLFRVRAITYRSKFRKLVFASYSRFQDQMLHYRGSYNDFERERSAVNTNIHSFQRNFDLLSITAFLKNLDMAGIEKKKIMGDNFTPEEMSQLERNLYIRPVGLERFGVPLPLDLPPAADLENKLGLLSNEVFHKYEKEVKTILRNSP